ncbi:ABC transporter substrate-binding protein [Thalassobaculum sp.]|uniref:ABC transporter substrate-binding protein n=1 Tax=Thalassobaculum sp. TaxID=2022740 RepID=UPI0032EB89CA
MRHILGLVIVACAVAWGARASASELTVQLGWVHHPSFAGFYIAEDEGYYAAEGLNVTFVPGGPGVDAAGPVISGGSDIGMAWSDAVLQHRAAGAPIVALAAIYRRSPVTFFSLPEANIRHPRDFIGQRVRATPDLIPALSFLMGHFGIEPSAYQVLPLPSDPELVLQGAADVWGAYVTGLPAQIEARGLTLNHIYPQDYGFRAYARVIFATEETVRTRRADLVGFLRASMRGWLNAIANHANLAPFVQRRTQAFSDDEIRRMFAVIVPLVHTGQDQIGWMTRDDWQTAATVLEPMNPALAGLDVDALFDLSLLQEAYGGWPR